MTHYPCRDGASLSLQIIGHGQPVVLLHGLGASGRQWLPFVCSHRRRFRFYIPDLRAMGRSAGVSYNQPDIFQNHMQDLEDLLDHFALDQVLLGGHSLGNTIALHWQRAGGFQQVLRYLHIDQSPCVKNQPDWSYGVFGDDQPRMFGALAELRDVLAQHSDCEYIAQLPYPARLQMMQIIGTTFARILGHRALAPILPLMARSPALLARHFPVKRLADLDKLLGSYLAAHDYRDSLRGCPTPTTVIVGRNSPIYDPRGQKAIADWVQNGQVVEFPRAGHMPPFQQPLKFAHEFGRFLQGTTA